MPSISINFGLKSYDICDDTGEVVGTIRFNPADLGIPGRWAEVEAAIRELAAKPYENVEDLIALDKEIKKQFDYGFGTPVSSVLFGQVSSLALCEDGSLVVEHVLEAVTPIIKTAQEAAAAASASRVSKYTAGYTSNAKIALAPEQK